MQIGSEYSMATPRIALIESSRPVCWISSSARLSRMGEAGADADALVLLADANQRGVGAVGEWAQQTFARGDIWDRNDERNAARLDFPQNARAGQPSRRLSPIRTRLHAHSKPPPATAGMLAQVRRA